MESQGADQGADDVPVIYLHEIKRQYLQGEVPLTILDGAKLALWAGQSVALVAPSGSGKSTLLHIAGLLESPDDTDRGARDQEDPHDRSLRGAHGTQDRDIAALVLHQHDETGT